MCVCCRTMPPLTANVVCECYWKRSSPFASADITKHYSSFGHGWYGVPKHRVTVQYDDGTKQVFTGTFRSVQCQKLAVRADGRTP